MQPMHLPSPSHLFFVGARDGADRKLNGAKARKRAPPFSLTLPCAKRTVQTLKVLPKWIGGSSSVKRTALTPERIVRIAKVDACSLES